MSQRKPIYDEPSPAVVLVPAAPSALQLEVGRARQFVQTQFATATGSTHGAVDRVLGAERRVERACAILGSLLTQQAASSR